METEKYVNVIENIHNNIIIKKLISCWYMKYIKDEWFNPPYGKWHQPLTETPLLIDNEGNIIEETKLTIKEKWKSLLEEADINLKNEDNACNIIMGALKGHSMRKNINNIYNLK
tara:strand:- start:1971 stop:2312 length:342 start_codon:yes stop_codon:yes gene_type:complete